MTSPISLVAVLLAGTFLSACGLLDRDDRTSELPGLGGLPDLHLQSATFSDGDAIPVEYTCDGDDVSPPLEWSAPPESAATYVLIVDDPDAPRGTFTHWILFNIPAEARSLAERIGQIGEQPEESVHGENDFGASGYRGPCPPAGEEHTYRFTLFALESRLDLAEGADRAEVIDSAEQHIVAGGQLTGTYRR